jgi:stalled ribosome rescue protein Dom34
MKNSKKNIGIWLDKRNAVIVKLNNGKESVIHIVSDVEEGNIRGGSGSSTPYGSQDTVSEKHMLERTKNQLKTYYNNILDVVKAADNVLIMGPAETKIGFVDEIKSRNQLNHQQIYVKTTDNMTVPQITALVRNHFKEVK